MFGQAFGFAYRGVVMTKTVHHAGSRVRVSPGRATDSSIARGGSRWRPRVPLAVGNAALGDRGGAGDKWEREGVC